MEIKIIFSKWPINSYEILVIISQTFVILNFEILFKSKINSIICNSQIILLKNNFSKEILFLN